ncbi:hypothetical protein EJ06DRAFT_273970 [Trichodelitschia bisporula]|uniref:Uncharacterized protein n=1 Tax=Trichodelitschia bisporula TaxID=703511 RepID=A0A6G1I4W8_9PEZI|nr:hypothetical protein EJ06DRAFT_273970 [Trichodelitschia bisporula]
MMCSTSGCDWDLGYVSCCAWQSGVYPHCTRFTWCSPRARPLARCYPRSVPVDTAKAAQRLRGPARVVALERILRLPELYSRHTNSQNPRLGRGVARGCSPPRFVGVGRRADVGVKTFHRIRVSQLLQALWLDDRRSKFFIHACATSVLVMCDDIEGVGEVVGCPRVDRFLEGGWNARFAGCGTGTEIDMPALRGQVPIGLSASTSTRLDTCDGELLTAMPLLPPIAAAQPRRVFTVMVLALAV